MTRHIQEEFLYNCNLFHHSLSVSTSLPNPCRIAVKPPDGLPRHLPHPYCPLRAWVGWFSLARCSSKECLLRPHVQYMHKFGASVSVCATPLNCKLCPWGQRGWLERSSRLYGTQNHHLVIKILHLAQL